MTRMEKEPRVKVVGMSAKTLGWRIQTTLRRGDGCVPSDVLEMATFDPGVNVHNHRG